MQPKSERIELRLDEGFLSRIDEWRDSQSVQTSRSEALRVLIDMGLQTTNTTRVKFSDGEKFIIAMISDWIHKKNPNNRYSKNSTINSLVHGNYWALEDMFKGIFNDKYCNPEVASETTNILTMCSHIESCIQQLNEKERNTLIYKYLNGGKEVFLGFSLQKEEAYKNAVSQILLSPGQFGRLRFEEFSHRRLNESPAGRLDVYLRMDRALSAIMRDANQEKYSYLSFRQLDTILDAGFSSH